jgi:hypothetical protein
MSEIVVTVDGVKGNVKFIIANDNKEQVLKFRWAISDEEETGFISNMNPRYIGVTEIAAEIMLNVILTSIAQALKVDNKHIKIFNHLGVQTQEIEFLPPTVDAKEVDLQRFVSLQDSLRNLYSSYEESQSLSSGLIQECEDSGVLEDFLSLVQFQLRKPVITLSKGDSDG